jgi:hypothetical protein
MGLITQVHFPTSVVLVIATCYGAFETGSLWHRLAMNIMVDLELAFRRAVAHLHGQLKSQAPRQRHLLAP